MFGYLGRGNSGTANAIVNGSIIPIIQQDRNPYFKSGTMTEKGAENEYTVMEISSQEEYQTDSPVLWGSLKGSNGEISYVVSAVGQDGDIRLRYDDAKATIYAYDNETSISHPISQDNLEVIYGKLGRNFRGFHDAGYIHQFPWPGNIGLEFDKQQGTYDVILRDLDPAKRFPHDLHESMGYRFIDIERILSDLAKIENGAVLRKKFLEGYFYDLPEGELDKIIKEVETTYFFQIAYRLGLDIARMEFSTKTRVKVLVPKSEFQDDVIEMPISAFPEERLVETEIANPFRVIMQSLMALEKKVRPSSALASEKQTESTKEPESPPITDPVVEEIRSKCATLGVHLNTTIKRLLNKDLFDVNQDLYFRLVILPHHPETEDWRSRENAIDSTRLLVQRIRQQANWYQRINKQADTLLFAQVLVDAANDMEKTLNGIDSRSAKAMLTVEPINKFKFREQDIHVFNDKVSNDMFDGQGQFVTLNPRRVDVRVSVEPEMVNRDLVDDPVDKRKEGAGRSIIEFVQDAKTPRHEDILMAFNGITGNYYEANSAVLMNGKLIVKGRRADGGPAKGVCQKADADYKPLDGLFWFLPFDPIRKGEDPIKQVLIRDGKLAEDIGYKNGIFGADIINNGVSTITQDRDIENKYIGLGFTPAVRGQDVNFTRAKREAISAMGYTADGKLFRATLMGDPNDRSRGAENEPTIDEFVKYLIKKKVKYAMVMGTVADVKTYIKESPEPYVSAKERMGVISKDGLRAKGLSPELVNRVFSFLEGREILKVDSTNAKGTLSKFTNDIKAIIDSEFGADAENIFNAIKSTCNESFLGNIFSPRSRPNATHVVVYKKELTENGRSGINLENKNEAINKAMFVSFRSIPDLGNVTKWWKNARAQWRTGRLMKAFLNAKDMQQKALRLKDLIEQTPEIIGTIQSLRDRLSMINSRYDLFIDVDEEEFLGFDFQKGEVSHKGKKQYTFEKFKTGDISHEAFFNLVLKDNSSPAKLTVAELLRKNGLGFILRDGLRLERSINFIYDIKEKQIIADEGKSGFTFVYVDHLGNFEGSGVIKVDPEGRTASNKYLRLFSLHFHPLENYIPSGMDLLFSSEGEFDVIATPKGKAKIWYSHNFSGLKQFLMSSGKRKPVKDFLSGLELNLELKISDNAPIAKGLHNRAMNAVGHKNIGGIDLTPARMNVQVKSGSPTNTFGNDNLGIKFHLDPAMLTQLRNAPGFVPVIINIQPMTNLRRFLGINDPVGVDKSV